nr:hypothetical protein [Streptomyces sp. DSM 41633]
MYNAIADSMLEGATPDRESMLRLIELAAGRMKFDPYTTQTLQAHTSTIDRELRLADTMQPAAQSAAKR